MADAGIRIRAVPDLPLIAAEDDLASTICDAMEAVAMCPQAGDIIVVAQKIVSKAEGRMVHLADVTPSDRAQAIARESG